jgi:thymidylate synthase (FAD)
MKIKEQSLHEHGFVRFIDIMGSDGDIADAARVSYGKGTRTASDNRNLIRYLVRHKHTSPLEMVEVKFHLKLPIFIMRQLVRHRTASLNEYSGRYSIMTDDCYEPSDEYLKPQSQTNKQGRGGELSPAWLQGYKSKIHEVTRKAIWAYKYLLGNETTSHGGLTRELARTVLPVSNYTECYWKIDLHNFFHFCRLRMDDHAQQEIQDYARCMFEMVKPEVPLATEAFEDYSLNSMSLSRMEWDVIKKKLKNLNEKDFDMSKREWKELEEKIDK